MIQTKFHQILFSTPMVEAINCNRKNQTRRLRNLNLVNGNPNDWIFLNFEVNVKGKFCAVFQNKHNAQQKACIVFPYGKIGDVLWVRETWQETTWIHPSDENYGYIYKASENGREWAANDESWVWKPSLFMPRAACRLFLQITTIRIERLQQISNIDAKGEGIMPLNMSSAQSSEQGQLYFNYTKEKSRFCDGLTPYESFSSLWRSINGEESWAENPWVWVIEFSRIEKPENFI